MGALNRHRERALWSATLGKNIFRHHSPSRERVEASRCYGRMKHALLIGLLLLAACHRENASGLTQKEAEQKLLADGYTYPTIGPSPEGYTGYGVHHGYKVDLTLDKHGVTPKP